MFTQPITIIIPAFNESKNISLLLPRIFRVVPKATIIIVDDSMGSEQKQTQKICQKYGTSVMYHSRNGKAGRGSAVLFGMRMALTRTNSKIVVEMDADLAHDPKEIPMLCAPIRDVDMVVGSRYMKGSLIAKWTWSRLIQSKIINFLLTYWLGLHITDYTNGFRAYSRKACQFLITAPLREKGFIVLSEIAYMLHSHGFRIMEVPITFTDREYGKSNANFSELMHSLRGVFLLRYRSFR